MNVNALRAEIPALANHPDLIYFDNAATAFKPRCVIDAVRAYDGGSPFNIGRGDYAMARMVGEAYENARKTIADVFGVESRQVIFTSGATDAVNLLAASLPVDTRRWSDGAPTTIISEAEHHSNWLPWWERSSKRRYILKCDQHGEIDYRDLERDGISSRQLGVVAVTAMSNATGYVPPLHMIDKLTPNRIAMCVDATQRVAHDPHMKLADYHGEAVVLSSHKIGGPTGVGALVVLPSLLDLMTPSRYGGGMVRHVSVHDCEYGEPPHVFEAGTPPIAQAIGFAEALKYRKSMNTYEVRNHLVDLSLMLDDGLKKMSRVRRLSGDPETAIQSFVVDGMSVADVGKRLDEQNVCVRVGNHCAQPYHRAMGVEHSVRVSLQYYNTEEEVEKFLKILGEIVG